MASMASIVSIDSCNPAPYGRACVGCARAKSKCFYRADGLSCERCHRLAKPCEPSAGARQRTSRKHAAAVASHRSGGTRYVHRPQAAVTTGQQTPDSTPSTIETPSSSSARSSGHGHGTDTTAPIQTIVRAVHPPGDPDVVLDPSTSVIQLLRPESLLPSPVLRDIAMHYIAADVAEEQLATFRRSFLTMFPFVHLPDTLSASELRQRRPFLWLTIMCLSTKSVAQQFAFEETIWNIVSQRIVVQYMADLDLLLGLICFASWSHYFKRDKPFMSMLAQLAVSLAIDLGLHQDPPANILLRSKSARLAPQQPAATRQRTIEERRTMLAVYHLTSTTWAAYRRTQPYQWTPYMDDCIRVLSEERGAYLDPLLVTQVKCHLITNQLDSAVGSSESTGEDGGRHPTAAMTAALMRQLTDLKQSLPADILQERTTQFYLVHTELTLKSTVLKRPRPPSATTNTAQTAAAPSIQRLQDLETTLCLVERWLALLSDMPPADWVGVNVDSFSQLTHCLVVLFKLSTLRGEPGWDADGVVRHRANVFELLDRYCETVEALPAMLGLEDTDGTRKGLFFKSGYLLRAIKTMFVEEMTALMPQFRVGPQMEGTELLTPGYDEGGGMPNAEQGGEDWLPPGMVGDPMISDAFLHSLADEPWMSELFDYSWNTVPPVLDEAMYAPMSM